MPVFSVSREAEAGGTARAQGSEPGHSCKTQCLKQTHRYIHKKEEIGNDYEIVNWRASNQRRHVENIR